MFNGPTIGMRARAERMIKSLIKALALGTILLTGMTGFCHSVRQLIEELQNVRKN